MPNEAHAGSLMVPCGHCKGSGYVPLPDHLQQVLSCFTHDNITTRTLIETMLSRYGEKVRLTAMCNRLNALEEFGLVSKVKIDEPTKHAWYLWKRTDNYE